MLLVEESQVSVIEKNDMELGSAYCFGFEICHFLVVGGFETLSYFLGLEDYLFICLFNNCDANNFVGLWLNDLEPKNGSLNLIKSWNAKTFVSKLQGKFWNWFLLIDILCVMNSHFKVARSIGIMNLNFIININENCCVDRLSAFHLIYS